MKIPYYVVDAFAERPFSGNPAGVCLLDRWPDDRFLQNVAMENNLSETAFLVRSGEGYDLRWFTPTVEVDLCGHATLASAYVIANHVKAETAGRLVFQTRSGLLTVTRQGDWYEMNFPSRPPEPVAVDPALPDILGAPILEAHQSRDLLLLLESEAAVAGLAPDFSRLKSYDIHAFIVTAPSRETDFVCRFFAPSVGINEDPVTGSAQTTLIPFWAKRLGRTDLVSRQLSARGGVIKGGERGERVTIAGQARLYLEGFIQAA